MNRIPKLTDPGGLLEDPSVIAPQLPPRSILYSLQPIGVGTPQCESLRSYFLRLAAAHCVSPDALVSYALSAGGSAVSRECDNGRRWKSRNFCTIGEIPSLWSETLTRLTSVKNLQYTTLLPVSSVLTSLDLAEPIRKWCPLCLEHSKETGVVHEHLIWELRAAEACPIHGIQLEFRCPKCDSQDSPKRVSANKTPGYCFKSGHWLGASSFERLAIASNFQISGASQLSEMIAYMPHMSQHPATKMGLANVINEAINYLECGEMTRFSDRIGVSKTTLWAWQKDGVLPRLAALLHIALSLDMSLISLITGDIKALNFIDSPPCHQGHYPHVYRISPTIIDIPPQQALKNLLEMEPPPSTYEVAELFGTSIRRLYRFRNDEMKALAARHREYIRGCAEGRFKARCFLMERIASDLKESGEKVTVRKIMNKIGPNWNRNPRLVIACKGICASVNASHL